MTIMRTIVLILLLCALVTTAIATTQNSVKSPFKLVATVKQVMTAITIPASDAIFDGGADAPKNDTEWESVQNGALALAESGNLLMLPGRTLDNEGWVKQSQAMIEAAMIALKAAREKNVDNLMDAGDKIYGTCEGCHDKYMDKSR